MKSIKIGLVIAVFLTIALSVVLSNWEAKSTSPGYSNDRSATPAAPAVAVARVNSVAITAGELEEEMERLLPPTASHGHTDEQQKANLRKKAMEELVVRELAYQKAKAMGLQIAPTELAGAVRKIRGHYKTDESFQQALRAEQITEPEFIRRVRKDLLLRKIHKLEIDDKAAVSDAVVKDDYEKNKAKFVLPESIHLWQIVVKGTPDKGAAAKQKINEAFRKLNAGEAFDAVAYKYSEDDYRVMGGDYGWIHRGQLAPELEQIAFAAKPRVLTGPVQTSFGWQILRVEDRQPEHQLKFEEVKDKIASRLKEERLTQAKAEFVRELKAGANIQYLAPN
jgi:parvulin-like peptidyl-prolyl isomerase